MGLTPVSQLSNDALVEATAQGDERAFGELVRRHGDWLLGRARRIAPDQAEDVTQAALMNAYRSIRSGTRPTDFERWLGTIVRNTAISELRRAGETQPLTEVPDRRTTFDEVADRDRLRRAVDETKRLPELERAAITAQAFEGRRTDEIAHRRGASEGSVRMAVHRARRRLRATVPLFSPLPGIDLVRRAFGRVRDVGPLGGAATAGAIAAVAVAGFAAGGFPGGADGGSGELAVAQVESPGLPAPAHVPERRKSRQAGEAKASKRKPSRRKDRNGGSDGSSKPGNATQEGPSTSSSSPPPSSGPGTAPAPSAAPPPPSASPPSTPPQKRPPNPPPLTPPPSTQPQPQPPPAEPPPPSGPRCPGLVSCVLDGIGGALKPGK